VPGIGRSAEALLAGWAIRMPASSSRLSCVVEAPLATRMRPRSFEEFVGHKHVLGPGKPLTKLIEGGHLPSMVLWGPPGTGKTTLAYLLARAVKADLVELSAVTSGVSDTRRVIEHSKTTLFRTVLFVDEVHRWNRAQQEVLLPAIESGTVTLIGATTENPYHALVGPLLSRSLLIRLEPLEPQDVRTLLDRALADEGRGMGMLGVSVTDEALDYLVEVAGGDARVALTGLEASVLLARAGESRVGVDQARDAVQKTAIVFDRAGDAHYDVTSAFIKSLRGSDPDAALFWLARMIEGGEDPRFIARRMVILASEDVGVADPQALVVAVSAAQAVELVGLPEARLNLAEAAVYLARAPKSNSVYVALERATEDARSADPVPLHLRDAHYAGARRLGHGEGYLYPHDHPGHRVEQEYRPARFEGRRYYEPSGQGEDVGAVGPTDRSDGVVVLEPRDA
jgi:putative ATPase